MVTSHKVDKCLACSILKDSLEHIIMERKLNLSIEYISCTVSMKPKQLNTILKEKLLETSVPTDKTLLLFGDCHPHIEDQIKKQDGQGLRCVIFSNISLTSRNT